MARILVVEDSADIRFILKTELEWHGFTVDVARDARIGLDIARLVRPDVILSDVLMPDVDGFEFIKRIRQHSDLRGIPAIALTGTSTSSDVHKTLAAGFTIHITKPVDIAYLISVISKLAEKKLLRKAS